ncbi:MAG: glutamine synthetase type III, partial [Crocinitomicaceae bacterium]|nr:glutamine synthetase type III [Crocinitomicaceae bacterium]
PQILLDNTDRNRTSPFAFTGNKFEFRAVGSTANCSSSMIALNTIVAKQLQLFKVSVDARIVTGEKKDEAILKELQKLIIESKNIRFEGNGYGDEWVKEAKKRGLSNFKNTPRALAAMVNKKTIALFEEMNVLSSVELHARHEIELENYVMKLQIEARILGDISYNYVIPAAIKYQKLLVENVEGIMDIMSDDVETYTSTQIEMIKEISKRFTAIKQNVEAMITMRKKANKIEDLEKRAETYCDKIKPFFDKIKYDTDKLEMIVADEFWPLPKLREMLFAN